MRKTMSTGPRVASATLLLCLLAACGGEDEPGAEPTVATSTSSASTTTTPSDPPTESAAPTGIELADACQQFADGWIGGTSRKSYNNDATLAQTLFDAGDPYVRSAFEPIVETASAAADSLGSIVYVDDEEAFGKAIVQLDGLCRQVGSPILES